MFRNRANFFKEHFKNFVSSDKFPNYIRTGILTGSFISVYNSMNWSRSPIYKEKLEKNSCTDKDWRFRTHCFSKGTIYGTFWPISCFAVTIDLLSSFGTGNYTSLDKHFVPYSKHRLIVKTDVLPL